MNEKLKNRIKEIIDWVNKDNEDELDYNSLDTLIIFIENFDEDMLNRSTIVYGNSFQIILKYDNYKINFYCLQNGYIEYLEVVNYETGQLQVIKGSFKI